MDIQQNRPRLLIAGISGSSGKTMVSMGLLLLLRSAGFEVRAFKKGPDYIDPQWLGWAAAHPARNLDTLLMGSAAVLRSFARNSTAAGINVIEGNRGLYDGYDAAGTHSSAVLAKTLLAPVLLVIDAKKITRTAAAVVLGCQRLDPAVSIRGVVLNNVSGGRHEQILRSAIESTCSIPVLGAIPRCSVNPLPERHLGLVPAMEHGETERLEQTLLEMFTGRLDLEAIAGIAENAQPIQCQSEPADTQQPSPSVDGASLKIGYLHDSAFSFYYPDNLEALESAGAELIPISGIRDAALPHGLHALYIGGGFPETHAHELAKNKSFLVSLRNAAENGLPIYAECGGLMLLAQSILWNGLRFPMASLFPFDVEVCKAPQGHGYSQLRVDAPNAFFPIGSILRGHEFHYSRIAGQQQPLQTACSVSRGAGCLAGRDSVIFRNVMASYTHLHALATPEWVSGMLTAARHNAQRPISA